MRRAALLTALTLLAAPAAAAVKPVPGISDPRISSVFYDPDEVVQLQGFFGYQLMIEFEADERIENVSIGDAVAWQVTPNRKANLLFLKPIEPDAATNMTVVTDRRRYAFELTARRATGGPDTRGIAYVVRFVYPAPPPLPPAPPPPPKPEPERRNVDYTYTGSRASLPSLVFDDGRFTYFQWAEGVATPALFQLGTDGSESIVNYGVRDGFVVVEQLAPRYVLRNGTDVTVVINNGWREPAPGPDAPRPADEKSARDAARAAGIKRR